MALCKGGQDVAGKRLWLWAHGALRTPRPGEEAWDQVGTRTWLLGSQVRLSESLGCLIFCSWWVALPPWY